MRLATIRTTMHRRQILTHLGAASLALLAGCARAQPGYTIS